MYWPKCREDDRVAGREVRRQRAWSRALAVSCPVHGEPLTIDHFDRRNWGGFGEASPLSENEREVLALIDGVAKALDASLFAGAPWPADWRSAPRAGTPPGAELQYRCARRAVAAGCGVRDPGFGTVRALPAAACRADPTRGLGGLSPHRQSIAATRGLVGGGVGVRTEPVGLV